MNEACSLTTSVSWRDDSSRSSCSMRRMTDVTYRAGLCFQAYSDSEAHTTGAKIYVVNALLFTTVHEMLGEDEEGPSGQAGVAEMVIRVNRMQVRDIATLTRRVEKMRTKDDGNVR